MSSENEYPNLWRVHVVMWWTTADGWSTSATTPEFLLDGDSLGIVDGAHACRIGRRVVDNQLEKECSLSAVKLLPGGIGDEKTYVDCKAEVGANEVWVRTGEPTVR